MNMNWRIALAVCIFLYGVLALYQQKRISNQQNQAASESAKAQAILQRRLDSMDVNIGNLNLNQGEPQVAKALPPPHLGNALRLEIVGANISVPSSPPESSSLALVVAVHNASETASVAADYRLEVITPDQIKHVAVFIRLGDKGELKWTSASGVVTVIPASDALEDKTENREIVPGGTVRGRVLFLLPGVPQDQVIDPRTILNLSARNSGDSRFFDTETIEDISKK